MEWQPIETAPKNTPILVNNIWIDRYGKPWPSPLVVEVYNFGKEDVFSIYGSCDCNNIEVTPTHWMPLPAPPVTNKPNSKE